MNKAQKEVLKASLADEKRTIRELKQVYKRAKLDCEEKIKQLSSRTDMENIQSIVYQKKYQEALVKQLDDALADLEKGQYQTVSEYTEHCYETGYIGTMYDLQNQGIPVTVPIDKKKVVTAIQTDTKLSSRKYAGNPLKGRLEEDVDRLKTVIRAELSRSVANGASWNEVAVKIAKGMNNPFDKAYRDTLLIARTEGHRVQQTAQLEACQTAKDKGADVVKQWDATLDGKTRPAHREADGQIRELDEDFDVGGEKMKAPAVGGSAKNVCNCRCGLLQRARWALDEAELEELKKRAEFFGLDKSKDFEDFKKKYLKIVEEPIKQTTIQGVNEDGSKMLSNAYENHRLSNNMTSTPYDELGDSASDIIKVDYGKMSVESASAFNETIGGLVSEYDTPLQRIRTMTKEEFMVHGDSFAYVWHDYSIDSAELIINPTKCKDIQKLKDRIIELSENGHCVMIPEEMAEKYVATHEFAHTLINLEQHLSNKKNWVNADYDKIKKVRKEIKPVYDNYLKEVQELTEKRDSFLDGLFDFDDFERMEECTEQYNKFDDMLNEIKLSEYSLVNADEFMAEAFANEKIGLSSKKHSKQVLEILDKHFKR